MLRSNLATTNAGTHSRGDGETMTSLCVCPSIRHVGKNGGRGRDWKINRRNANGGMRLAGVGRDEE